MNSTSSIPTNSRYNETAGSSLWKISSGKNGDKYLLFSGSHKRSINPSTEEGSNLTGETFII